MNTSFFLSIDAIAEDAGSEGEEVGGGDTGVELIAAAAYDFNAEDAGGEGEEVGGGDTDVELIAAAAYDFLPETVDFCC